MDVTFAGRNARPPAIAPGQPTCFRKERGAASNARFYRLSLDATLPFTVIGVDGGLLDRPVTVNEIIPGPAERVDAILDFTGRQHVTFTLTNSAPAPFPMGDPPDANTSVIMQFRVVLSGRALKALVSGTTTEASTALFTR